MLEKRRVDGKDVVVEDKTVTEVFDARKHKEDTLRMIRNRDLLTKKITKRQAIEAEADALNE